MSVADRMRRALSATPAELGAFWQALEALDRPEPCPRCGGAMGDGDRVSAGMCAICRRVLGR